MILLGCGPHNNPYSRPIHFSLSPALSLPHFSSPHLGAAAVREGNKKNSDIYCCCLAEQPGSITIHQRIVTVVLSPSSYIQHTIHRPRLYNIYIYISTTHTRHTYTTHSLHDGIWIRVFPILPLFLFFFLKELEECYRRGLSECCSTLTQTEDEGKKGSCCCCCWEDEPFTLSLLWHGVPCYFPFGFRFVHHPSCT